MIRLRIATSEGFQEITPKTLSRCGFTNGCRHAGYVDGPADPDPYYHCDLYDQRTDGKRLYQCMNATNPVIVELMRTKAEAYDGYSQTAEVPFPQEHMRDLSREIRWPLVYHTLRFERTPCICDAHGTFLAALLPSEEPTCPRCIEAWENAMREVLYKICTRALAHLAFRPHSDWSALGENPLWNPTEASL